MSAIPLAALCAAALAVALAAAIPDAEAGRAKISLDPVPGSLHAGEHIVLSGRLSLGGPDVAGATIHIMDYDPDSTDALLASAYVNHGGGYELTWTPGAALSGQTVRLYAAYGADYGLSTCEAGTRAIHGGPCPNAHPVRVLPARAYTPPGPAGTEYVALNYALPFGETPKVAIVPDPSNYDRMRAYAEPAIAGLKYLESELRGRHGGDWSLDYEIVGRDGWQAQRTADVVLRLITRDIDTACDAWGGWAPGGVPSRPIEIHVCTTTTSGALDYDPTDFVYVMRIATHEFIHAIGVGHVFNIANDMMCSVEAGGRTCPGHYAHHAYRPSGLVLDAIAALYGTDGYLAPHRAAGEGGVPGYMTQDRVLEASLAPALARASASPSGPAVVLDTAAGEIVIELFDADAPNHANNFRTLADSGFYDGSHFGRIVRGFLIEGGDAPSGDGGTHTHEHPVGLAAEHNSRNHMRGTVSMAASGDGSSGSKFFIMHGDARHLDGQHTAFGRLATAHSYETLDALASLSTDRYEAPARPERAEIVRAYTVAPPGIEAVAEEAPVAEAADAAPVSPGGAHTNTRIGVSVEYPRGWSLVDSGPYEPTTLRLIGPETAAEHRPVIAVSYVDHRGSIHQYASSSDRFGGYYQYETIKRPSPTTIDGHYALESEYVGRAYDGMTTAQVTKVDVKVDDGIYTIRYLADEADHGRYAADFDGVLGSLELSGRGH